MRRTFICTAGRRLERLFLLETTQFSRAPTHVRDWCSHELYAPLRPIVLTFHAFGVILEVLLRMRPSTVFMDYRATPFCRTASKIDDMMQMAVVRSQCITALTSTPICRSELAERNGGRLAALATPHSGVCDLRGSQLLISSFLYDAVPPRESTACRCDAPASWSQDHL